MWPFIMTSCAKSFLGTLEVSKYDGDEPCACPSSWPLVFQLTCQACAPYNT